MDYAFVHAVQYWDGKLQPVLLLYDVACQYHKHLLERINKSEYLFLPDGTRIKYGIGQFHIHGHKKECFVLYVPTFIPGAGQVDGEIIETLWAPLDEAAGSIRGMGTGHRQESIDMLMADSNWKKMTGMCTQFLCFYNITLTQSGSAIPHPQVQECMHWCSGTYRRIETLVSLQCCEAK